MSELKLTLEQSVPDQAGRKAEGKEPCEQEEQLGLEEMVGEHTAH